MTTPAVPTPPPTAPAPSSPASPAPPTGQPAGTGPRGSEASVLADLASERDRRQAAEAELATLRAAQAERAAADQQAQQAQESAETARVRTQLEAQATAAQAQAATATALLVREQARRVAVSAGVHDDRSETFLRLVDLAQITLGADGRPDEAAIRTQVDAALDEAPEFRAGAGPRRTPIPGTGTPAGATPAPPPDLQGQVSELLRAMQTSVGLPTSG